ncbi:MAG: hypothetical protein OSJ62_02360 [Lachnospiraceae bacterium]|nr:hypothetical protein [Lachnospiraceae bacterium]
MTAQNPMTGEDGMVWISPAFLLTYQGSSLLLSCEGESGGLGNFLVSGGMQAHLASGDSSIGL